MGNEAEGGWSRVLGPTANVADDQGRRGYGRTCAWKWVFTLSGSLFQVVVPRDTVQMGRDALEEGESYAQEAPLFEAREL